jgi:glycosyltransferase involved in cell wall biosynthesis
MRKRLRVVVEGWRFLNHSYAVSNRHYLQWLLNDPRLEVYHREMPYFRPEWQAVPSYVFPSHLSPALELGTPPSGFEPDWTLRFDFPHRLSPPQHGRLLVFMTSEYTRLNLENIAPGLSLDQAARDDRVHLLTCSLWSARSITASGFPAEKIWLVPLGVEQSSFEPTEAPRKAAIRARLGIGDDEHVILNVGAGTFNKGLDLVIQAFARQAAFKPRQRLIIKGLDAIYGNAISNIARLSDVQAAVAELIAKGQVLYIGSDLSDAQMDELYRLADTYVTPYRAEGFNIPALEAAARGLQVIATEGGSTDDFLHCFPNATGVDASPNALAHGIGFLEPDRAGLESAILAASEIRLASQSTSEQALRFSWGAVSHQLSQRLLGHPFHG